MISRRTAPLLTLLLLSLPALAHAGFPYNGGFEQLDKGVPVGWDLEGTWLSLSPGGYLGRKAIYLAGTVARAGDRLLSQGYRLASPGDTLTLRVAYLAAQGGSVIGLQPCDALGRPLGDQVITVALPEADAWTVTRREIALTVDSCPRETASVRVVLGVDSKGHEVRYDAVRLTGAGSPSARTWPPPVLDVYARPNLLKNPNFKCAPDGTLPWWTALGGAAVDSGSPRAAGPTGLTLTAGAGHVAWLSAEVPVDASLPYRCSVPLPAGYATAAGHLGLVARLRDPTDSQVIWLQAERLLTAGDSEILTLSLPRLFAKPRGGRAEVALTMAPGTGESIALSGVALRPEPITLAIRPVAMAGEFTKPTDVTLFISATNNTRRTLNPMAYMKILEGPDQAAYEARRVKIDPQSSAYFPFKPKLTHMGSYHMLVRLMENGQDLGSTTFDFRVGGG